MKPNSKTYDYVPHKLKMYSKKLLRARSGTSTGWRNLIMEANKELDNG